GGGRGGGYVGEGGGGGDRGRRRGSADHLARLAAGACGGVAGAPGCRAGLPSGNRRQRLCEPRRGTLRDRAAAGIARRGRGGADSARRDPRAETGGNGYWPNYHVIDPITQLPD